MKLIYQGFDGLDVSFQGKVLEEIKYDLKTAKEEAIETNKLAYAELGIKKIPVLVRASGAHGYQYILDTGIDRETWFISENSKSERWNIRVSIKSLSLALYGYEGVKKNILKFLEDIKAQGVLEDFQLLERVSRFDYCFDFISDDFTINPQLITANKNSKRRFIGGNELISQNKDIETVLIGKMPNRQIAIYNKKKEINIKNKQYWLNFWNLTEEEIENKNIWRVEIRAGKKELDTWNLKRFNDFEEKAGDVLLDIAKAIRYLKENINDINKARWENIEFWDDILNGINSDLFEFINKSKRKRIIEGLKIEKINDYRNGILNLISPYMALTGREYDELADTLTEIEGFIGQEFYNYPDIYEDKIYKAKERFIFLE
jgi:hypothetical protein